MNSVPPPSNVPSAHFLNANMGQIDLNAIGVRQALSARIKADIDEYCIKAYDDGYRSHLGASLIGRECWRELWYGFRWAGANKADGRMYRLWNRGHREEERFIEWLRGIGFEVKDKTETGEQFRITGVMGHFGGSMDSQLIPPARYQLKQPLLIGEFKTQATGSKFNALKVHGIVLEKPQHFDQMSSYGRKWDSHFGLYICINKNDDDLHVEIVELDWKRGQDLENKAAEIIAAKVPPNKIAQSPAFKLCQWCDFRDICHFGKPMEKSCRSCVHATAVDNKQWHCARYNDTIPADFIKQGCAEWKAIA